MEFGDILERLIDHVTLTLYRVYVKFTTLTSGKMFTVTSDFIEGGRGWMPGFPEATLILGPPGDESKTRSSSEPPLPGMGLGLSLPMALR